MHCCSFKKMDPSVSGRDAEAVYRDKTGWLNSYLLFLYNLLSKLIFFYLLSMPSSYSVPGKRMSKEEYLKSQKKEEKPKVILWCFLRPFKILFLYDFRDLRSSFNLFLYFTPISLNIWMVLNQNLRVSVFVILLKSANQSHCALPP